MAKREEHRLALRAAATGGEALLPGHRQRAACRCRKGNRLRLRGLFTATNTLSILAEMFEQDGALDRLEAFASLNGPAFYGLPPNEATRDAAQGATRWHHPDRIDTGDGPVTVFDPDDAAALARPEPLI